MVLKVPKMKQLPEKTRFQVSLLSLSEIKLLYRMDLETLLTIDLWVELTQNNFLRRSCTLIVDTP